MFILTKIFNLYQYANGVSSIFANISVVLIAYSCFIEHALLEDDEIIMGILKQERDDESHTYYRTCILKGEMYVQNMYT